MTHIVKCRWCGERFDTDAVPKDKWIQPVKRWYYHADCWKDKNQPDSMKPTPKNVGDDFLTWRENIFILLERDFKISCNYARVTQQMQQYKTKNKDWTYKGMFLALKWFYEVKNGDPSKSNGGIGILPYVYYDGTEYWRERERLTRGITAQIEQQMRERAEREPLVIKRKESAKERKGRFSLDDV